MIWEDCIYICSILEANREIYLEALQRMRLCSDQALQVVNDKYVLAKCCIITILQVHFPTYTHMSYDHVLSKYPLLQFIVVAHALYIQNGKTLPTQPVILLIFG